MITKELFFITGNKGKFEDAKLVFKNSGISLKQKAIETPEIQALNSIEISKFSANYISKTFNKPFFVMDRSFHIESLSGFPGPFVKYINSWLTESQICSLVNKSNRNAFWSTSISVFFPNKEIVTFESKLNGTIAVKPQEGSGYTVDKIFIPDTNTKTVSQFTKIENSVFWNSDKCWTDLKNYILNEKF